MKRITLLLLLTFYGFVGYSQCDSQVVVTPTLCSDPANGVYIVDPNQPVSITIEDDSGNPQPVVWAPRTHLYADSAGDTQIPNNFSLAEVFFLNAPENGEYQLFGQYTIAGCSSQVADITIITGGFVYDEFCKDEQLPLANIDILGNSGSSLDWYADSAGNTPLPSSTNVEGGGTYYIDLDFPGCSELFPVNIEYGTPLPEGGDDQRFCSQQTWLNAGVTGESGDAVEDLNVCGSNITWYSDAAGQIPIFNPSNELLVTGQTYYVTQTIGGCESDLLAIEVTEQECSCIRNEGFQSQNGTVDLTGSNFYSSNFGSLTSCSDTQNYIFRGGTNNNEVFPPFPVNSMTAPVSTATPGADAFMMNTYGIYVDRTSPLSGCSTNSIKLNDSSGGSRTASTLQKTFVAGEVMVFDFVLIVEDPSHAADDQPFMTIRLYDDSTNQLIQQRCIVSNPDDCIFTDAGGSLLYSAWSCLKMNTIELQGQSARVEITIGDCDAGAHWGSGYIDNFYIGDDGPGICDNSAFGYMAMNPLNLDGNNTYDEYEECSLVEQPQEENCEPALPVANPSFPIEVCGTYANPTGGNLTAIELDVLQNGSNVGTITSASQPGGLGTFCFTLNESDLSVPPYGYFTFDSETTFTMNCGSSPYQYFAQAQSNGFKICPVAECPSSIQRCDDPNNPLPIDLTSRDSEVLGKVDPSDYGDYSITYYSDEQGAHNQSSSSQITGANITSYPAPAPGNPEVVYVRLDFDYTALGISPISDCYDVVPLEIIVGEEPVLPASIPSLGGCGNGSGQAEFDLTQKRSEILANVTQPTTTYTVTYYAGQSNYQSNAAIDVVDLEDFESTNETIYVIVEGADGCTSEVTFDVVVSPFPPYSIPAQVTECEGTAGSGEADFNLTALTNTIVGSSALMASYYNLEADAESGMGTPLPDPYQNANPTEQIFVRLEDPATSCVQVETINLQVTGAPVANDVGPYYTCEGSVASGQGSYTLTDFDNDITGGAPGVTVTYYSALADAQTGTGPTLPTSYTTTSNNETIYARVAVSGDCYNTASVSLIVEEKPDLPANIAAIENCDEDGSGTAGFNLENHKSVILANETNPSDFTVTYYAGLANYQNDSPIATSDLSNYDSANETIYVLVEGVNGCTSEGDFDVVVNPLPTYNTPQDLTECDQDAQDGVTPFDLNDAIAQISGGNNNLAITFYISASDAEQGPSMVSPLPLSYTNSTANSETIFVRIEDNTTSCYDVSQLTLNVVGSPAANTPNPLEVCDDNNDGSGSFPLGQLNSEITGGDPSLTVSYYQTLSGAQNDDTSQLITPPFNSGTATIGARVESSSINCYNTVEVDLVLLPSPDLPSAIAPLEECDENETGMMSFDLEDRRADILANVSTPGDYTVRYFDNAGTQITGGDITDYESGSATITVEVEGSNGCTAETTFDLIVNPLPAYNDPEDRIICDTGVSDGMAEFDLSLATAQITGNDPNLEVLYYEGQSDAQTGASNNLPLNYTNTNSPYNQTIYVRLRNKTTDCYRVLSLNLQVNDAPNAFEPAVYVYCDDDNDGEGTFYLPDLDDEITGGAPGVTVSYHLTEPDARNNGVNPLPDNYNNDVDYNQTIFARVESPGVSCYNVVEVELEVRNSPQAVTAQNLEPLEECDDNESGNAIFDLTQRRPDILANESNPSGFTLTYYASQADLTAGDEIDVPSAYPSDGMSQTIYVVVEGSNGCQDETSFEIMVNPLPTVNPPSPLELCDVNNPGDEKEVFDLTDATLEITGGDTSIDVKYYASQDNANSDTGALPTSYENTVNNESIYIRVEDTDTGCVVTEGFTLTLVVYPIPSPEIPDGPIEVCDVDNDGIAEFELGDLTDEILNNEPNVVITYHRTLSSANSGGNSIDTSQPFQISSAGSQVIYVRATNTNTDCYTTGEIELISVPTPEIGSLGDLYECDDDDDGFAVFDLTENTANIIGSQDPDDLNISYHIDPNDAITGDNAIVVPSMYTNIVNNQTIYVRLENDITKCIDVFDATNDNTFQLIVEPLPAIMEPAPLQLCDDDYNNVPVAQAIFDLTSKEGEVTGQALPPNSYEFTYYASEGDYLAGNSIGNPDEYENEANPQDIYVEVVNAATTEMCTDVITMTIEVLPLPSPSITDPDELRIEECDDDNDGIAADPFDLTEAGNKISGSENVDLSYYKTENAAEDGNTSSPEYITDETAYVNEPAYNSVNGDGLVVQEIYVRVDSGANGNFCYVIVPIEIRVVRAPVLTLTDPDEFGYTLCEDGTSGQATLFLEDIANNLYDNTVTDPDPSTLIPLLDQAENDDLDLSNYTVTYYEDPGDAETGTDPISSGDLASDGDVLYIRVEYEGTGCYNTGAIGAVRITVEPRPGIQEVDITEVVCSDEQGGSTATIDLTGYNDQINPGSPAGTDVVYYAGMDDYMTGDNIEPGTLAAYTTVENPQTIVAEVIDTNTLCESAVFATITVEVDDRPVVDISSYSGVICEDSNPSTPTEGGNYDPILIETGLPDDTYSFVWSLDGSAIPGGTGPTLEVTQAGTYTVEVTNDVTGCSSTSSATFTQSTPPEFTVAPLTLAFDEEHAVLITATGGSGDYEFSVDNGPWISVGADGTLAIDGLSAGNHYVYGRDLNGCGVTVNTISFIDYPKFFTPNEDGYNDRWNIIGLGEENAGAKIYVFDRYGKLLKQLSPSGEGWDGTYNGKVMPSGDYWFRIEYLQLQPGGEMQRAEFKANFTLKR